MIPPPVYFLACLIVGSVLQYVHPLRLGPYSFRAGAIAGVIVLALAATMGMSAALLMMRRRTPIEPWKDPVHLVTSGPFRVSRNPLYLTLTMVLIAVSIIANSIWLLIAGAVLLLLLDRVIVRREERVLHQVFGDEYRSYKSRVRRWI